MWILPKSLISAFAPDMEALTSDSAELSQTCERSLMRRSKPSPAKTYWREWKAGNLMRLRSGAISKPSLGSSFLGWWTSSLVATHVSHSVAQASGSEQKTNDIFGPTSQAEFVFLSHESASSRTLKDTSRWDSPQLLAIWKSWVTRCRGEYSARLNAVHRTSASECLSWPTASTRDYKGGYEGGRMRDGKVSMDTLDVAVAAYAEGGLLASWPTPTVQEAGKIGNQANYGQTALSNHPALRGEATREKYEKSRPGPADPANHSTTGSRPESWATPRAEHDLGGHRGTKDTLHSQMKQAANGKLNPRWVETLMGLPVGWTMPSCASPVTIAPTSYASSETE